MELRKITQEELDEILRKHKLWLEEKDGGERANLSNADLSNANLSNADLSNAVLSHADLSNADLWCANLSHAVLSNADLSNAVLSNAVLSHADLSNASGLMSSAEFIGANLKKTEEGIIAYKTFNETCNANSNWQIEAGKIISENVNCHRTNPCGCGINVATPEWILKNTSAAVIWKCLIRWEWLADVCVPYASDGKIRCGKVELIESYSRTEFKQMFADGN